MAIKHYRELEVWNIAMDIVIEIYFVGKKLPSVERFGLIQQLQRSAVSIPSNIAEGYGRLHRGDYIHHLSMARGSLCELETQLILCGRLGYITKADARKAWGLCQSVGKMMNTMLKTLGADRTKEKNLTR
jgi:four helix bundle protein